MEGNRASEANTLVFQPAAHSHSGIWKHDDGLCFNIEVTPQRLDDIQRYASLPGDSVNFTTGLANQLAMRLYREFQQPDSVSPLVMEGLTLELLAAISRSITRTHEPIPPRWLRTVTELLEARYQENLSLVEIAASVDVHPSHLTRVFRQHCHCSVGDYVRRLRMEYIRCQLTTSDLSLGEVALAAGFADQSHFTKTFKRALGITPAEYRRRFRRCILQTKK